MMTVRSLAEDISEILAISAGGQTIRIALSDIPTLGRTTQGVRIMRLDEGDSVASVGLIPSDSSEE